MGGRRIGRALLGAAASLVPRIRTKAANDIRRIWLDRKVRASSAPPAPASGAARASSAVTLDRNLTQIGAPAAWRAGITGRGVTVAVLDTGVDPAHPDLKDRVAETANFSEAAVQAERQADGQYLVTHVRNCHAEPVKAKTCDYIVQPCHGIWQRRGAPATGPTTRPSGRATCRPGRRR